MSLILDIYQSRKTLANLQQVVQQLKQDVMRQMDVPPGQKAQVKNQLGDTVKQTVVKKVNGKMKRRKVGTPPAQMTLASPSSLA